jgi:3-oxoacyl-[acyl-carrier protein] reductase
MTLAGKVVVVTGGSRGIGRACVLRAVALGARVVFCSRANDAHSRDVEAAAAEAAGPEAALGIAADVADEGDVGKLFEIARARFGGVHGVVNNAAVIHEGLLVSVTTEDWDAVIETNLTGGFLVAREAIRAFISEGTGGRIVTIGTLSQHGVAGNASYAVSKGGLEGLTREITRRHARAGITSSMVIPGYVETALSAGMAETSRRALIEGCPMRRPGSPDEIASVVAWLLSDAGAGHDGRPLFVSGGLREVPL